MTDEIVDGVEAAARRHRWLVSATEAEAAGLSRAAVQRLCATGRWVQLDRGVYAVTDRDGGPFQIAAARLHAAGPRAFLQCRTAAAVHGGLDLRWDGDVDLAATMDGPSRLPRRRVTPKHLTGPG